jgi:hypothetical protein
MMPTIDGTLTDEDNEKIQRWWSQHWQAPVICPVCKTSDWITAPHVMNVTRHAADAYVTDTVSYPHIVVSCKKCAHSMFFNAVAIGVAASHSAPDTRKTLAELVKSPTPFTDGLADIFGTLAQSQTGPKSLGDLLSKKKDR